MSALVVTFNNADEIAATLDALLAQRVGGGLEVIVVDNGSTDGTVEQLAPYAERVVLVLRDTNSGYAAANNEALELSSGELVALVNPDCVLHDECLERLAHHLDASPGVGLAAAMLENTDGSPQLFARRELTLRSTFWTFTVMGERWDQRLLGGRHAATRRYAEQWPPSAPTVVDCPAAACVVFWRHLAEPQLFSPALPLLFNDAEFYRRLRDAAYRLEVVPVARATHGYGTSLRRVVRGRMRAERLASLRAYVAPRWGTVRCSLLWLMLLLDTLWMVIPAVLGPARGPHRVLVRAGLGGLGLPGGARPWLTTFPSPARRMALVGRRLSEVPPQHLRALGRAGRRLRFLVRLRGNAWRNRVQLTVDVHPTAEVHRAVLELRRGSSVTLQVGRGTVIGEGVILRLGGELLIGSCVEVQPGADLTVNGRLVLGDRVLVGRGTRVQADGQQTWDFAAQVAEHATVRDSERPPEGSSGAMPEGLMQAQGLTLGANVYVGPGATILPGASVGDYARVDAGFVLTTPLAGRAVAHGVRSGASPTTGISPRSIGRSSDAAGDRPGPGHRVGGQPRTGEPGDG
jgi:GT2 family glycosyltransferase/acetyltransferase-like isoleucine patch superfamily enzyme